MADTLHTQDQTRQTSDDLDREDNKQTDENNRQDNMDLPADLWDDSETADDDVKNKDTRQQQDTEQSPAELFNQHIDRLKLTDGLNFEELANDIRDGNHESLQKAMLHVGKQAYRNAVLNVMQMVNNKFSAFEDSVLKNVRQTANVDTTVRMMNSQLPFTKDPMFKPVAESVLGRLLKRGKNAEEAIRGVRDYFKRTQQISAKELGVPAVPRGRPGSGNFNKARTIPDNLIEDDADLDFMKILSGDMDDET